MKIPTSGEDRKLRILSATIEGCCPGIMISVHGYEEGALCVEKYTDMSWLTYIAHDGHLDAPRYFEGVDAVCEDVIERLAPGKAEESNIRKYYYSLLNAL